MCEYSCTVHPSTVEDLAKPVLGYLASQLLNLIFLKTKNLRLVSPQHIKLTKQKVKECFADVFTGLGCLPGQCQ